MRKLFAAVLTLFLAVSPVAAQHITGLTGVALPVQNTGTFAVSYHGSGGASYWHSLWALNANTVRPGSTSSLSPDRILIACKDAGCVTNSFFGEPSGPVTFNTSTLGWSNWVFGLAVSTSGGTSVEDMTYWLYSDSAFVYNFTANDTQLRTDGGVDIDPTGVLSSGVIGWEDIRRGDVAGGDLDFNDALFSFEQIGDGPSEVVPEPATMTLLATGLVGMAAARRRKKNAA